MWNIEDVNREVIMTFETWLEEVHNIDHMTFTLRHPTVQAEMIREWNNYNWRIADVIL